MAALTKILSELLSFRPTFIIHIHPIIICVAGKHGDPPCLFAFVSIHYWLAQKPCVDHAYHRRQRTAFPNGKEFLMKSWSMRPLATRTHYQGRKRMKSTTGHLRAVPKYSYPVCSHTGRRPPIGALRSLSEILCDPRMPTFRLRADLLLILPIFIPQSSAMQVNNFR